MRLNIKSTFRKFHFLEKWSKNLDDKIHFLEKWSKILLLENPLFRKVEQNITFRKSTF
jgi:hypothetical protein